MIQYDYVLKKNQGTHTEQFTPRFPTSFPNIAKLKGPNSSGKSTLQNFIALSTHGLEPSVNIPPKLKENLRLIDEADYIEFEFEMTCGNEHTNRVLHAKMNKEYGKKTQLYIEDSVDNGATFNKMTKEQFLKKYRLIYDIPDSPLERVGELIKEIRYAQGTFSTNLQELRRTLKEIKGNISRTEDKSKIEEYKIKIEKLEQETDQTKDAIEYNNEVLKKLKKINVAHELENAQRDYDAARKKYLSVSKNTEDVQRENRQALKDYKKRLDNLNKTTSNLVYNYNLSIMHLSKIDVSDLKNIDFETWKNFNLHRIIEKKEIPAGFVIHASKIHSEIERVVDDPRWKGEKSTWNVLNDLLRLLKPHISEGIYILDQNLVDLYSKFEDEFEKVNSHIGFIKQLELLKTAISVCFSSGRDVEYCLKNLGEEPIVRNTSMDALQLANEEKRLCDALQKAIRRGENEDITLENYKKVLEEVRIDPRVSHFVISSSEEIDKKVKELEKENLDLLDSLNGRNGITAKIAIYLEKIERIEKTEESEFRKHSKTLNIIESLLSEMQAEFTRRNTILDNLITKKPSDVSKDVEYVNLIWINLGKRLKQIRHIGTIYSVESVDMIQKIIQTTDGRLIRFNDMGTGESQNAYLRGLLNNDDGRIVIALFDEIEHMDPKMIRDVENKFKEMYRGGQLMLGLMAAPGEEPEVETDGTY